MLGMACWAWHAPRRRHEQQAQHRAVPALLTFSVHLVESHSSSVSAVRPLVFLVSRAQTMAGVIYVAGTALRRETDSPAPPLRAFTHM